MKNIERFVAGILLILSALSITAQGDNNKSLKELSPQAKMQILADQIQLRDDRIIQMEEEITRLQKRKKQKTIPTATSEKDQEILVKKLQTTEETLEKEQAEKQVLLQRVAQLETQIKESPASSNDTSFEVDALHNKLIQVQSENGQLKEQLSNIRGDLSDKQQQIISLQNSVQNKQSLLIADNDKKIKGQKRKKVSEVEKQSIPGKNYFYISVGQSLDIDDNYAFEIGSIKSFNKNSSKAIRLGLDVAYLSANLTNLDLNDIDTAIEEPAGSVGIKIGPNLNIRLVKGIILNANYRFFPAADLTTIDEEINVDYKGYHTVGGSVKIGPLMARLEVDVTPKEAIPNITQIDNPMTVYLGLMF